MASDAEWRKKLSEEEFEVLRQKGTENPFTGKLLHNKEHGSYACKACGQIIFNSETKFDSGSGWPSFYDVASTSAVALKEDNEHGMRRVEVTCSRCGSHLGHVFRDAPSTPTGMRFCINSVALNFKKVEE